MKIDNLKAKNLQKILIIIILLISIGGSVGFYFAQDQLKKIAIETNASISKAGKLMSNSSNSAAIKDPEIRDLANKTLKMTYQSNNFQEEASKEIRKYAIEAGITINNIELAPETTQPILFGDIKTKKLLVSIGSPAPFVGLMKFMRAIESNIPKMQIINLSLSNIRANNFSVTIEPMIIEVYVN